VRASFAALVCALGGGLALAPSAAAAAPHLVKAGNFDSPVYAAGAPGDNSRLFVVEQAGTIRVARKGKTLSTPFVDLRSRVEAGGERGLLSMAFDPGYAKNRRFYVYYTNRQGDIEVDELKRSTSSRSRAKRTSRRTVIVIAHRMAGNHNGGQLQFGPDKMLYLGTGDGGGGGDTQGNGQNTNALLGKLLRIDPRKNGKKAYRVPSDNPFVGRSGRSEIWSYGLRNPFRFSFDRVTGDLTIGDVGQNEFEEVDFVPRAAGGGRGANFGWNCFEGFSRFSGCAPPGYVEPVISKNHGPDGYCAIIGGYVVHDRSLPSLRGRYIYGDNCNSAIRDATLTRPRATGDRELGLSVSGLSSFGETPGGCIYAASLEGPVYRLTEGSSAGCS
jgi:glucose/arabinose dehydrogenase